MFKVGDIVRIKPELMGKPCNWGGIFGDEYWHKDSSLYIVKHFGVTHYLIGRDPEDVGVSVWHVEASEIEYVKEEITGFVPSDIEKIISIALTYTVCCFLSPSAAKKIKLKDADVQIFKIYDIDFDTQKVLLRNSRWVSWSDIRLTSDQEFEVGDTVIVPKNYHKFRWCGMPANVAHECSVIEVNSPSIDLDTSDGVVIPCRDQFVINKKYFTGAAEKVKEVLDEAFFVKKYPKVFSDLAKKVFEVEFDSYESKAVFYIMTNAGKKIVKYLNYEIIIGDA